MPMRRAPSMSCARLSPTITASPAGPRPVRSAACEDARMRLHVAVLGRRDGDREQAVEREVLLERRRGSAGCSRSGRCARPRRGSRAAPPARLRRARSGGTRPTRRRCRAPPPRRPGPSPPMPSMMRLRVADEDLGIVDLDRRVEQRSTPPATARSNGAGIDLDAVTRAEVPIAAPWNVGPGMDQREVDVEEDRPGRRRSFTRSRRAMRARRSRSPRASGSRSSARGLPDLVERDGPSRSGSRRS